MIAISRTNVEPSCIEPSCTIVRQIAIISSTDHVDNPTTRQPAVSAGWLRKSR
jgi:hypothetical protein